MQFEKAVNAREKLKEESDKVEVYSSKSNVYIKNNSTDIFNAEIYDLMGRLVTIKPVYPGITTIDFLNKSGAYIAKIYSNNTADNIILTKKIYIE